MRRDECREEPKQMANIVQWNTANRHYIMLVVTTLYMDATMVLIVRLDAWQKLGVTQGVGFA